MSKVVLMTAHVERDNRNGLVDCIRFEFDPESKKYAAKVRLKNGSVEQIFTSNYPHRPRLFTRLTKVASYVTGMGVKRFEVVYPDDCGQVEF
ncbi:MAG: hypothetical protein IE909_18245 [Campylobacterales bacterium]|nr:hypothetical protein [Campylobacterales bacterium]